MEDVREKLAPYSGKRVVVRGWADRADNWQDMKSYRLIPTRCIQRPEVDGQIVCGHVWLFQAGKLKELGVKDGDYIEFEAEVCAYKRKLPVPNRNGLMRVEDYKLQYPSAVRILEKAERLDDPPEDFKPEAVNPKTSLLPEGYAHGHKTKVFGDAIASVGPDADIDTVVAEIVRRGYEDTQINRQYASHIRWRIRNDAEATEPQPVSPTIPAPVQPQPTPLSLGEAIKLGRRAISVFGSDPDKALSALSELDAVATQAGGLDKLKELIEALR